MDERKKQAVIDVLKRCSKVEDLNCSDCPLEIDLECIQKVARNALTLIRDLTEENKAHKNIIHLLQEDIAERDAMLEQKVEEVYPEFMRDYKAMREELDGCYEELAELRKKVALE